MEPHVEAALTVWGLEDAEAELFARRENEIWRVRHASGDYALRFHRPGYRTGDELRSELQWMEYLATHRVSVPKPLPSRGGALVEAIDGHDVDLLEWLAGSPIGAVGQLADGIDPVALGESLGQLMARLHDVTDAWAPPERFTRPDWRAVGLLGEEPVWGRFWENPDLSADDTALFLTVRKMAAEELQARDRDLDQGLIHADLLLENVLHTDGKLSLIDFDDCAIGYRDFELATFLVKFLSSDTTDAMRQALCRGYADRREVDPDVLDLMLVLRALTYVGWIVPRLNEPGGRARANRAIATAKRLSRNYVERRNA